MAAYEPMQCDPWDQPPAADPDGWDLASADGFVGQ